jgi:hypothetical protein
MAFTADSFSISRMASPVGTMTKFDVAAFRLKFHFLHNWQTAVRSGADHKPVAFPGYLFSDGQGRMPKLVTDFLEGVF